MPVPASLLRAARGPRPQETRPFPPLGFRCRRTGPGDKQAQVGRTPAAGDVLQAGRAGGTACAWAWPAAGSRPLTACWPRGHGGHVLLAHALGSCSPQHMQLTDGLSVRDRVPPEATSLHAESTGGSGHTGAAQEGAIPLGYGRVALGPPGPPPASGTRPHVGPTSLGARACSVAPALWPGHFRADPGVRWPSAQRRRGRGDGGPCNRV